MDKLGIVGVGQMGSGIAEVAAKAGVDVVALEIDNDLLGSAQARIEKSLRRAVERGKLDEAEMETALGRIGFTTDLDAMHDRELVIEAATENEDIKTGIFAELDRIAPSSAILASNTSSLPITRIARATQRPESVVGMHFFNPVPVMGLMELVSTVLTSDGVRAAARSFGEDIMGKTVIDAKDRAGFIVNMLLVPYMTEAMKMYEQGFASAEDIDAGMRLGANHPMGPLELADFIGLDTMKFVADVLFDEFKQPQYAPPPLLVRMVEAGLLGRKTGRGFYDYS
ncbi:MAG: 3-hydroxybutyryl-CoA dehydrogenase [Acidimicrobiia bacterium]|nr:3-hydroxybutyryl-CoA dehydrogenase [Acidimicrobiia bacterium]